MLSAVGPEHFRVKETVEQEARVGRLRGDARDTADVDVGAARTVHELEVEEDRLVVSREARRRAACPDPCRRRTAPASRSSPRARRTAWPGSGGTKISGSKRVATTWAAWLTCAGSTPLSIEKDVGVEPRALVPRSDLVHDPVDLHRLAVGKRVARAPRRRRAEGTAPSATATQNSSGVASSVPMTRPAMGWFVTLAQYGEPPETDQPSGRRRACPNDLVLRPPAGL